MNKTMVLAVEVAKYGLWFDPIGKLLEGLR